ncbi:MAG: tetratricopeptide repeat protein [Planctomycetota bacterium]
MASKEGTDPRDAWMPTALEELFTRRFQRVHGLLVVPTVRLHQARRELQEADAPPAWPHVIRGLGVNHWLTGEISGAEPQVTLDLVLQRLDVDPLIERRAAFTGRLLDILDQATRWTLEQFALMPLPDVTSRLVFEPPSRSPSALEYYARAIAALENESLQEGLRCALQSLDADRLFRPALALVAQLESQAGPAGWGPAARRLQALGDLARVDNDHFDRVRAEVGLSLVLQAQGAFDAGYTRATGALELADEHDDIYGRLAALTALCDGYLLRRVPKDDVPAAAVQTFARANLQHAADWQRLLVHELDELGDFLGELPAANKLALLCEKLEQPDEALALHKRTLALADHLQSRRHQATAWLYLGQCHKRQERYTEAIESLSKCLALADASSQPEVRMARGSVYRAMKLDNEALAEFEAVWEAVRKSDDLPRHFVCLREIAETRMRLGRRDKAVAALQEAIDVAHALELKNEEQRLREQLDEWQATGG